MKRIAILQSAYVPWKGYFDLIKSVDQFVLYDSVQFSKGGWRNRNAIKTDKGLKWLTIPVKQSGLMSMNIEDVEISDDKWNVRHWDFIKQTFRGANCYEEGIKFLKELYFCENKNRLSHVNERFLRGICKYLNIDTPIARSSSFDLESTKKNERLIELCLICDATTYISGPSGADYLDIEMFNRFGISVEFFNYTGYPIYPQLYGEFEHHVSIIDLIFNLGRDSHLYLRTQH